MVGTSVTFEQNHSMFAKGDLYHLRLPFFQQYLAHAQEHFILKRISLGLPEAVGNSRLSKRFNAIRLYRGDASPIQRVVWVRVHRNYQASSASYRYEFIDEFLSHKTLAIVGDD